MALLGTTKIITPKNGGGKPTLWVAQAADVTSFAKSAGGEDYETATMEALAVFTPYTFGLDSLELKVTRTRENRAVKYVVNLEAMLERMSQAQRDAIEELDKESAAGLIMIFEDNNGNKWVLGYSEAHGKTRPIEALSGEGTTGKGLTDANGDTLNFGNEQAEYPRTFTGVVPV